MFILLSPYKLQVSNLLGQRCAWPQFYAGRNGGKTCRRLWSAHVFTLVPRMFLTGFLQPLWTAAHSEPIPRKAHVTSNCQVAISFVETKAKTAAVLLRHEHSETVIKQFPFFFLTVFVCLVFFQSCTTFNCKMRFSRRKDHKENVLLCLG